MGIPNVLIIGGNRVDGTNMVNLRSAHVKRNGLTRQWTQFLVVTG